MVTQKISRKDLKNDEGSGGLEIYIPGVLGDPSDGSDVPCSVFIEEYEGKVWVRIWDGKQDPTSICLTDKE
jgi:hypothetical protein